jgi:hypothetical protein
MRAFVSPDIDDPAASDVQLPYLGLGQQAFWPRAVRVGPVTQDWIDFEFECTATGVKASAPQIFLDNSIVELATALAASGRRVILAGTDTDFRGEPFGPMPQLLAVAEVVDKLHAICVVCGNPASRNQRLIDGRPARYDSPTIMVGGDESYEARCRSCHSVPRRDEDQVRLL